jgi:hypothetical protein
MRVLTVGNNRQSLFHGMSAQDYIAFTDVLSFRTMLMSVITSRQVRGKYLPMWGTVNKKHKKYVVRAYLLQNLSFLVNGRCLIQTVLKHKS